MTPILLYLHALRALLTAISLNFAQAGSDASLDPFTKVKASLGGVLATRVDGSTGTCSYRCILDLTVIIYLESLM